ncbi:hypothetical protein NI18_08385 [Sphingomonas sp. Ant20]|nr:hypothetical protein NI18_08385 [Sphingomonas sp. Ant20]
MVRLAMVYDRLGELIAIRRCAVVHRIDKLSPKVIALAYLTGTDGRDLDRIDITVVLYRVRAAISFHTNFRLCIAARENATFKR